MGFKEIGMRMEHLKVMSSLYKLTTTLNLLSWGFLFVKFYDLKQLLPYSTTLLTQSR